ncbi:MAG: hypothetical protein WD801_11885 [Gemmatimonadaceae bacterium]
MPIVPLYGHGDLRARLRDMTVRGALPSTLLLQGPPGVGKQRLALWLAQCLLCEALTSEPCGDCRHCRFAADLRHPDLHWVFPRPRPKDSDPDLEDVRSDLLEAVAERAGDKGLYAPPSGSDGIFVATIRSVVQQAVLSPSIAARKVFVIGDADRMVSQEGSDQAANAFLKLLEEPLADTTIILTSSESGALLPTVRSRAISFRVAPLGQDDMRQFLADANVASALEDASNLPETVAERLVYAAGAPGRLLAGESWRTAMENAGRIMDAVSGRAPARYEAAWSQAPVRARGSFADTLDALTVSLHQRAVAAVRAGKDREALAAGRAVELVEGAKEQVAHNVSPQLLTVNLVRSLQELFS